jgi:diguanylate cyclase (GGDEF)-like protein/PAS domain S-box-containing protein
MRSVDTAEAALASLLERYPDAQVFAIKGDGAPEPVDIPRSIPLHAHRVVDRSRNLRDEVVAADHSVVARLWGTARARGVAVAPLRLVADPSSPANLFLLDLRRTHGVFFGLLSEGTAVSDEDLVESMRLPAPIPRFAQLSKDAGAIIQWIDPALTQILGWTEDELVGRRILEIIHEDDREEGIANWMELLDDPELRRPVRLRHRHRDGSWVWIEVTNRNRLGDADHNDVLADMVDISEEMRALDALHAREQLLAQLTETVPVGLLHMDVDGTVRFTNSRLHEIIGRTLGPDGIGGFMAASSPDDARALQDALDAAAAGSPSAVEIALATGEAGLRHCTIRLEPLYGESGVVTGLTGCVEDVTTAVRTLDDLKLKALSDPLTGCLNRNAILALLQEFIGGGVAAQEPETQGTAVIFIDLDGFKEVNDQLGHAAGDEILTEVADRLRASVRNRDVVGRWGGDEFVVLCPGATSPATALEVARALTNRAFAVEAGQFQAHGVRASVGVSWSDDRQARASSLLERADAAMYHSKRQGEQVPVLLPDE